MTLADPIRILIVDDHAIVRQGLKMVLSLRPDFEVVGEVGTAADAIEMTRVLQPDLILLDLVLPDGNGGELTPRLREVCTECRILILSGVRSRGQVQKAVDAGVDGYILKEVVPDELVRAVHQVANGDPYLHPDITDLLAREAAHIAANPVQHPVFIPELTARELEVLSLMATTATNQEIAARLVVSPETVRTHVKRILGKLGQSTRTQAVVQALRLGLIELD